MSLSKKSKWFLGILILLAVGAFGAYKYTFKPHKTIEEKSVDYTGKTSDFISEISKDPLQWNDKVVLLNGNITAKDDLGIMLDGKVYCQFKPGKEVANIKENQQIKIKGRVIGYDDLLEELKLDQCILK